MSDANGKNKRVHFSDPVILALFEQTGGFCPLCGEKIIYEKEGSLNKISEIVHIYPLNPTKKEEALLKNEERLSEDVNHPDNLIFLCPNCHTKFDKPRTIESYRELVDVKKRLILNEKLNKIYPKHNIHGEINYIIERLSEIDFTKKELKLNYNAVKVRQKLKLDFDPKLAHTINTYVAEYYVSIRDYFKDLEKSDARFELIASEIKSTYLEFSLETDNQVIIFQNLVRWLMQKTKAHDEEACRIVISFFIQNCEVFEDVTK